MPPLFLRDHSHWKIRMLNSKTGSLVALDGVATEFRNENLPASLSVVVASRGDR